MTSVFKPNPKKTSVSRPAGAPTSGDASSVSVICVKTAVAGTVAPIVTSSRVPWRRTMLSIGGLTRSSTVFVALVVILLLQNSKTHSI